MRLDFYANGVRTLSTALSIGGGILGWSMTAPHLQRRAVAHQRRGRDRDQRRHLCGAKGPLQQCEHDRVSWSDCRQTNLNQRHTRIVASKSATPTALWAIPFATLPLPAMSRFDRLADQAPDAAFALIEQYKADPSPTKVDLSPGFYRDENGKPWVLPSVQMVNPKFPPLPVSVR